MDKASFLQDVIYIISALGILMGIDLVLGAKVTSNLNEILDTTVLNLDKVIANVLSFFKKTVESRINIDDKIIKTRARVVLGYLFIGICIVLIFLARKE